MFKYFCCLLLFISGIAQAQELTQQTAIEHLVGQSLKKRGGIVVLKNLSDGSVHLFGNTKLYEQEIQPGSLLKLAYVFTWLKKNPNFINSRRFNCEGSLVQNGKKYFCWTYQGHQSVDLLAAIAHSCNLFFASLPMDHPAWLAGLASQHLAVKISAGYDPNLLHYGDDAHLSTHFVDLLNWLSFLASLRDDPSLQPLFAGMRMAISSGTAQKANNPNVEILAKTGTTPKQQGIYRNDGFFVGMAPAHKPMYLIIVMVKDNFGFDVPASLAGKIFGKLLGEIT